MRDPFVLFFAAYLLLGFSVGLLMAIALSLDAIAQTLKDLKERDK